MTYFCIRLYGSFPFILKINVVTDGWWHGDMGLVYMLYVFGFVVVFLRAQLGINSFDTCSWPFFQKMWGQPQCNFHSHLPHRRDQTTNTTSDAGSMAKAEPGKWTCWYSGMRSRKRIHVLFLGGRRFFRLFFLQQLRTRYGITGWTESKASMFEVFVNMHTYGYIIATVIQKFPDHDIFKPCETTRKFQKGHATTNLCQFWSPKKIGAQLSDCGNRCCGHFGGYPRL